MKFHRTDRTRRAHAVLACFLLAALTGAARAQEPAKSQETPGAPKIEPIQPLPGAGKDAPKDDPVVLTPPAPPGDPHEEMERLFGEIELKMQRVNRLLQEAAAGKGAQASKEIDETIRTIDELLRESTEKSRSVVQDIDKLLELASHPHAGGT